MLAASLSTRSAHDADLGGCWLLAIQRFNDSTIQD
jgi:hypothetical protein